MTATRICFVVAVVMFVLAGSLVGVRIGMYACESHFSVGDFQK
jgi:hypothetical protein